MRTPTLEVKVSRNKQDDKQGQHAANLRAQIRTVERKEIATLIQSRSVARIRVRIRSEDLMCNHSADRMCNRTGNRIVMFIISMKAIKAEPRNR